MNKRYVILSVALSLGAQALKAMDSFKLEWYLATDQQTRTLEFSKKEAATWEKVTTTIREILKLSPDIEISVSSQYCMKEETPSLGKLDLTDTQRKATKTLKFEASTQYPPATHELWQEAITYNPRICINIPIIEHYQPLPDHIAVASRIPRTPIVVTALPLPSRYAWPSMAKLKWELNRL